MSAFDEATGLPALPDNHFWRIGRSQVEIMTHVPAGEWEEACMWHFDSAEYETRSETRDFTVKRWFRDRTVQAEKWLARAKATDKRVFVKRWGTFVNLLNGPVGHEVIEWGEHDPVTPQNIFTRCEETLAEWMADKATRALVGDYPPKAVGVGA